MPADSGSPVAPASPDASHPAAREERGSALVLAVFVLALVAGMGVSLLFLSRTELAMSRANLAVKQAFYLAEAGVEDGRRTLFDANGSGSLDDDLLRAAGPDGVIDFDPLTIRPLYDDEGRVAGVDGHGDDVPVRPLTALGESADRGWYVAFLTNDPVDGAANLDDTNARVTITGLGAGPRGSVEVVEAIVEPRALVPPVPPATITLLGPRPVFDGGASAAETYDGADCGGSGGVPDLYVPIVGTVGSSSEFSAESTMTGNPHYVSGPYTGESTAVDLTNALDPLLLDAGLGTIDPLWSDCRGLHDVVDALRAQAEYYCNTAIAPCSFPATTADSVIFVDGDVTLGPNFVGRGLLVCTGEVTFRGNSTFEGLLLVVGEGVLHRRGGGNGRISGATLVADIAGPDDVYDTADDCSAGPDGDGFDVARYAVAGGGNADVLYCTDHLGPASAVRTYRVVEFLQR